MVRPAAALAWYGTRAAAQLQGPRVPFSGVLTPTPRLFSVHHQDWRWRADSDALSLSPRCLSRPRGSRRGRGHPPIVFIEAECVPRCVPSALYTFSREPPEQLCEVSTIALAILQVREL